MSPDLEKRIARVAMDRESGASEILDEAMRILADALNAGANMPEVARALCRAQSQMAPVYNAAIAALAARGAPDRFTRFAARVSRAPEALARFAIECFTLRGGSPLRAGSKDPVVLSIATISYSRSVLRVLEALSRVRSVHVACSEGRPAFEGRTLALRLASRGVHVTFFTDAAIGHALDAADAVLVGADAVAPEYFVNKSGTRMFAAAATQRGVPVYVLASRDKFASHAIASRLRPHDGAASEVWEHAPADVIVRNPYFESTPLELITSVITDIGILDAGAVADVCEAVARETPADALELLD